eukprot:Nk52_evm20s156 gene=Nk52_evmTU20s156
MDSVCLCLYTCKRRSARQRELEEERASRVAVGSEGALGEQHQYHGEHGDPDHVVHGPGENGDPSGDGRVWDAMWGLALTVCVMLTLLQAGIWCLASNDWFDLHSFVYGTIHQWMYVGPFIAGGYLVLSFYVTAVGITSLFILIRSRGGKVLKEKIVLSRIHKAFLCLILSIDLVIFGVFYVMWPYEPYIIVLFFLFSLHIVQIVLILLFTLMSCLFVASNRFSGLKIKLESMTSEGRLLVLLLYLMSLVFIFFIPFIYTSPNVLSDHGLPPRPQLIGHRGCAALAPENTLAAYHKAYSLYNVSLYEADVFISMDGVPFILHDDTFKRTTNVSVQFTGKEDVYAGNFTWEEIGALDAGSKFVEVDPFLSLWKINETDINYYKSGSVHVPKLAELARLAIDTNKSLIFDLEVPVEGHPYRSDYLNVTLDCLVAEGMNLSHMFWTHTPNRTFVHVRHPSILQFAESDEKDFTGFYDGYLNTSIPEAEFKFDGVNLNWDITPSYVKYFHKQGFKIVSYVVDSSWLFSILWSEGVDYITTNECDVMFELAEPYLSISWVHYYGILVVLEVLCVGVLSYLVFSLKNRTGYMYTRSRKVARNSFAVLGGPDATLLLLDEEQELGSRVAGRPRLESILLSEHSNLMDNEEAGRRNSLLEENDLIGQLRRDSI